VSAVLLLWAALVACSAQGPAGNVPAPSAAQPATVDVSDLPAWWEQNYSAASWYGLTSVPKWDGNTLTAETKLYADSDAVAPATSICGAMSMYWLATGKEFHSVRVVDGAGQILVSRHTMAEQCTWRR
jgi:hypothetical protein